MHVECSEVETALDNPVTITTSNGRRGPAPEISYDGSEPVFRLLRSQTGGSALMNLGYFHLRGPLGILNVSCNLAKAQRRLVMKSAELLNVNGDNRVLDVACGRGESSYIIQCLHSDATVVGLDRVDRHVQVARTLFGWVDNLSYVTGDAMRLDFPDRSFDRVLCLEAAFHFRDRASFLREAHRVLRPGGRLVVVDFAWNSDADRPPRSDPHLQLVRRIWQWEDLFSVSEYDRVATGVGFQSGDHQDWTSRVTAPIQAQLRCVSTLATSRWGRRLLYWKNPLLQSLSMEDWAACRRAATAQERLGQRSKYMAFVFEKSTSGIPA